MENYTVYVHHNESRGHFFGYVADDADLYLVFECEIEASDPGDAAERAFFLFNVGDDPAFGTPDPRAVEYRQRRLRSLSEGDVLAITTDPAAPAATYRWLSCDSYGWGDILPPDLEAIKGLSANPMWKVAHGLDDAQSDLSDAVKQER